MCRPAPMDVPTDPQPGGGGAKAPLRRTLSRRRRMVRSDDFDRVFSAARGIRGRTMVLLARRASDAGGRVGVIASRRTLRRAVDRNRAKRLLREAFRKNRANVIPNVDVVLIARAALKHATVQDVERDFVALAGRAHIRRDTVAGGEEQGTE